VAEFVGRNNILAGTVESVQSDGIQINTPQGRFLARKPPSPPSTGDAVAFTVSADLVALSQTEPDAHNKLRATLISEEFIGSVVTLFFEGAEGQELKVQMQERALMGFDLDTGNSFWLRWDSDNANILGDQ